MPSATVDGSGVTVNVMMPLFTLRAKSFPSPNSTDPTPLPLHGALPGLGLTRWGDFDRLAETGRAFRVLTQTGEVWMVDAKSSGVDWKSVADRLAGCALGEAVIEELGVHDGTLCRAVFGVSEGRWEMNALER